MHYFISAKESEREKVELYLSVLSSVWEPVSQ